MSTHYSGSGFYLKRKTNGIRARSRNSRRITLPVRCDSLVQCPYVADGSAASSALVAGRRPPRANPPRFLECVAATRGRRGRHAHPPRVAETDHMISFSIVASRAPVHNSARVTALSSSRTSARP